MCKKNYYDSSKDISKKVKIKDLKKLLNAYVNDEEGEIKIDAEDEFGIELDLKLLGFKQSVYNNNLILILKPR